MKKFTVRQHKDRPCFIELVFDNDWKYVYSIRLFILNLINEFLDDNDKAERIALAANELVENAVKYNAGNDSSNIHLKLFHDVADKSIILEVRNFASHENIEIFKRELEVLYKNNPQDSYLYKLQQVSRRMDGKTMLGLSRVRYEAECDLQVNFNNGQVIVTTVFSL